MKIDKEKIAVGVLVAYFIAVVVFAIFVAM
jgi:hypothetical protein